jgi:hypothetical protein
MTYAAETSKGVESSMKVLLFDRLSRTLVIIGCTLIGLGLAIAFIKNRGHYTEALWFRLCLLVTVVVLVLPGWLASSELHVRLTGMIFQLLGIAVALYFLSDVRSQLGERGIVAKLTEVLESPSVVGEPTVITGVAAISEGHDIAEAYGTATVHPKSLSTEDRFTSVENQLAKLESEQAKEIAAINRTIRNSGQIQDSRHQGLVAAVSELRELIVRLQTGGLVFAFFGIIWLALGAVLTSIPDQIFKVLHR